MVGYHWRAVLLQGRLVRECTGRQSSPASPFGTRLWSKRSKILLATGGRVDRIHPVPDGEILLAEPERFARVSRSSDEER